jgi:hypothetical protein
MALRPSTYTYAELAVSVKRSFGDESGVQLEDGDILRWANEGQQAIVTRNRVLKRKSTTTVVAGTSDYTFPSEKIFQVASIELNGSLLPNMTFEDAERRIMADDPSKTEVGRPLFWYEWGGEFSLWPKPDIGYTMVLRYTAYPDKLTGTGTQLLAVSDKYYTPLIDFILLKAYEMDEDWQAAQAKQASFEAALQQQGQEERTSQDMTYGVIAEVC